MTAALDALTRLDAGAAQPGDLQLADRLELRCQQRAFVWPEFCVHGVNGDCNSCHLDWDDMVRRSEDI